MDISNNTKNFWKNLKVGDIIGLQDKQAIEDQMEEGKILGETDYEVKRITTFKAEGEQGYFMEILFIELEREKEDILLSVKIADQDVFLRVFFEVEEFEQGNRSDILEREDCWVFGEPKDPEDFRFSDLDYATTIELNVDEDNTEYTQLPQGELYGGCTKVPEESGVRDIFMSVVEYGTDVDCDNPFMLFIEEESVESDEEVEDVYEDESDDGGYVDYKEIKTWQEDDEKDDEEDDKEENNFGGNITMYLGSDLSPLDLNVYPKGK